MKAAQAPETISNVVADLLTLSPRQLAELVAMKIEGPGVTAFWRLAARHGFSERETKAWMQIVRTLAILIPKGKRSGAEKLHQPSDSGGKSRGLGTILCDGGDPLWPRHGYPRPRPVISETRLARLLAMPAAGRGGALERIARMVATHRDPTVGFDCRDLECLLREPESDIHLRKMARDYYDRFDRIVLKQQTEDAIA